MRCPDRTRRRGLRRFIHDEQGLAATEFAMVLPILVALLLGTIDIGRGIWLDRKLITATQTTADLLTQLDTVTTADINSAITASRMILEPYDTAGLGYDIVGIRFHPTSGAAQVMWRDTAGMTADSMFPSVAAGLGDPSEGVLGVVMTYTYTPAFYGAVLGPVNFKEVAILRGRKVPYIPRS